MALDNSVLNQVFNTTGKKKSARLALDQLKNQDNINTPNEEPNTSIPQGSKKNIRYQVFDDPIKKAQKENIGQIQDKPRTGCLESTNPFSYQMLTGVQRRIVFFLFDCCKTSRDTVTPPISIEHLANNCKTTRLSAQKSLQRLEGKSLITRVLFKNGRGGWTRYGLPDEVYQEILLQEDQTKLRTNPGQMFEKDSREVLLANSLPTQNGAVEKKQVELPLEWNVIDYQPLANIGFTQYHVMQLYKTGLYTPNVIQDSILHFAFDLEHNNKMQAITKTSPIGYFMGTLRNQGPYLAPENYETPQAKNMRLYLEKKEQQKEKQQLLEKEILKDAFDKWMMVLTVEQIRAIVPAKDLNKERVKRGYLWNFFEKEIWSKQKEQHVSGINETESSAL